MSLFKELRSKDREVKKAWSEELRAAAAVARRGAKLHREAQEAAGTGHPEAEAFSRNAYAKSREADETPAQ